MKIKIILQEVEIDKGNHLISNISINGVHGKMIIDSGASETIIDKHSLFKFSLDKHKKLNEDKRSLGIGKEKIKSHNLVVERFVIENDRFNGFGLNNQLLSCISLDSLREAYLMLGHEEVDGIIGSDILKKYKAVINYDTKVMELNI